MRFFSAAFILFLVLIPQTHAAPLLERFELEGNVSLILSSDEPHHFILSLVNKNDFNVTPVKGIQINFTYDIDPSSIKAVDNHNQTVTPDAVGQRTAVFTYNSILPPLGYGKIFLTVERLPPNTASTTTLPKKTLPPTSAPTSPPSSSAPPAASTPPPAQTTTPKTTATLAATEPPPEKVVEGTRTEWTTSMSPGLVTLLLLLFVALVLLNRRPIR